MNHSALQLAALATAAVPGLVPTLVDPPHQDGLDFDVTTLTDSAGGRWVVRAARRVAAAAALDAERRILPLLTGLPVGVPAPVDLFEGGECLVYPEIKGYALRPEELQPGSALAVQIGRTIAAIHEIPCETFDEAGLPSYPAEAYRQRRLSDVERAARTGMVPEELIQRWTRDLTDSARWQYPATPVHADLAGEHLLVQGQELRAIIDWGEACVADPADDLAWVLLGTSPEAADTIFESYAMARSHAPDPFLLDRARLAGELALIRWLLGAVAAGEHAVARQAETALRSLADASRAVEHYGLSGDSGWSEASAGLGSAGLGDGDRAASA
ncbi:MAG: phosphotransferase [Angustibacter sp.]